MLASTQPRVLPMLKIRLAAVAALLALSLIANSAEAQSRVFVAAQGSDSNPCTFASPCRTFQHAHDVVAAQGEIDVLDPAGYGQVTIAKSLSIQGHGFAGISAVGNGVTISAGTSDTISLRGLLLDGAAGTGGNGVQFNSGASLNVQDCLIRSFKPGIAGIGDGIFFAPNAASKLVVSNTVIADNQASAVDIHPSGSSAVDVVVDRVEMDNNRGGNGLTAFGTDSTGTIHITVSESVAARNGNNGISIVSASAPTSVMVRGSIISSNARSGLLALDTAATIRVTKSTITGNATGLNTASGGTIVSFGNNSIAGNTADGAPTSTMALK